MDVLEISSPRASRANFAGLTITGVNGLLGRESVRAVIIRERLHSASVLVVVRLGTDVCGELGQLTALHIHDVRILFGIDNAHIDSKLTRTMAAMRES